jgi:hypothetical protein
VNALDVLIYEASGFYIMDKGYADFERLYRIHLAKAFFVKGQRETYSLSGSILPKLTNQKTYVATKLLG